MEHSAIEDTLELIRTFLPKYLTPEQQDDLFKKVQENFPFSIDPNIIYTEIEDKNFYYQGDALKEIPFSHFNKGKFKTVFNDGVIISNTCDISPENQRLDFPFIQFAYIYSLNEYIVLLKQNGIKDERIRTFISDLKSNRISNLFFFPEKKINNSIIIEESFVRFDLNTSLPVNSINSSNYNIEYAPNGDRLFSLSNYGFYLFLIKLSVHYCRFREGVFRN
jgi:hypothetical protein